MQTSLLQNSLDNIMQQQETFVNTFYQSLLANYPHLQPLFAGVDLKRQQTSLIATLKILAKHTDDEDLHAAFRKLGRLHSLKNIRAEHYPPFGGTLLATMARFDPDWTPAHREAWATALDRGVRIMMQSYDATATIYTIPMSNISRTRAKK